MKINKEEKGNNEMSGESKKERMWDQKKTDMWTFVKIQNKSKDEGKGGKNKVKE